MKETKLVRFPNHDDYVYIEIHMNEFQEFYQSDSEIYGWYKDEFISVYKELENKGMYQKYLNEVLVIKEAYESGDMLGSQPHIKEMFSNLDELIILTEEEFNKKNDEFKQRYE